MSIELTREAIAATDVASVVEQWASAQSGAIVDIAGREDSRAGWRQQRAHVKQQTARILQALMEADYPMEWAPRMVDDVSSCDLRDEVADPEIVGAALASLAAAARAVAVELGWEPKREAIASRKRTMVYRRDGYACVECGEDDVARLTLDHRVPVDLGGANEPQNLRTLCRRCNSIKGARL